MVDGSGFRRDLSRFVVFNTSPPIKALYMAHSMILEANGKFYWTKCRDNPNKLNKQLTPNEEKELLLQIMQSEIWQ